MKPYYQDDWVTIFHGDCREILPELPKVDLVLTDPPYFKVKGEAWDNQWDKPEGFLAWVNSILGDFHNLLKKNGTLYFFASPQMAGRIEVEVRKYFNVLNSLVWNKGASRKGSGGSGVDVTSLRRFWSASSERLIFAEHYGSDVEAQGEAGYLSACEMAKKTIIGDYLKSEFGKAGATNAEIAKLFPSKTGGMTGCVRNWLNGPNMPTHEQYLAMREYLNRSKNGDYLKREYKDLRRPFKVSQEVPWGDVWNFEPNLHKSSNHPCEKPLSLISHMVIASSEADDLILDPFMGSGTTLRAAKDLNRKAIGIEIEERYCEIAARRMQQEVLDFTENK